MARHPAPCQEENSRSGKHRERGSDGTSPVRTIASPHATATSWNQQTDRNVKRAPAVSAGIARLPGRMVRSRTNATILKSSVTVTMACTREP